MKKKIFSFILTVCLIVPCMFMIAGCKKNQGNETVKLINSDLNFAKQHINEVVNNTIKKNVKAVMNSDYGQQTLFLGYNDKSICYAYDYQGETSYSLEIYKDGLSYDVYENSIYVEQLEEGEDYLSEARYNIIMIEDENIDEITAVETKEGYKVTIVDNDADSYDCQEYTLEISNGLIRKMDMDGFGTATFEYISRSELIGLDNEVFSGVKELTFDSDIEDATSFDMNLISNIDEVHLPEGIEITDEFQSYLDTNFEFNGIRTYTRISE